MYALKSKNIIFISFIVAFMFCLPSFADVWNNRSSLNEIVEKLPNIKSIKLKFKQEKFIPNIEKPVISSGDFEFIENQGVYFYTTYPVKTKIDYTNKNYKQINDVVNAIASKKYKRIEKEFDFYYEGNENKWFIGLKPKEKTSEFLSYIFIEGSDYIQKIKIEMTNGVTTTLWFQK